MEALAPPSLALVVVEDSQDDCDLLVQRLRASGRAVDARRVEDADTLGEALCGGRVDAVVSDHHLPRFSSLDALALVRAHDRELPFIIVSGAIGEEVAVEAMRAGADDYVMKDNLGRLEPALARALAGAAARRRQRNAEAALVESEARFRALTTNLPGMVVQIEHAASELRLVYVSEGARRLFGLPPEALTRSGRWVEDIVPDDASALRALLSAPAPEREVRWVGRLRHDAGERFVELAASARAAGPARFVWDGIVTDITHARKAEAELRASREELRQLASHLTRIREQEREAIAREIHDDVGSTLTGLKFELAYLRNALRGGAMQANLARADELLDAAVASSTRIMHDLRPGILDEGVVAALEWQARKFEQRMSIACRFVASHSEIPLASEQAIALFRICQEALNNVAKHASASEVDIHLRATDGRLLLDVRDNGRGISAAEFAKPDRFGLRGMRERAYSLGGSLEVRADGCGTQVAVALPLARPVHDAASPS
jgi:two-component system sensor histidine kinase UhpB